MKFVSILYFIKRQIVTKYTAVKNFKFYILKSSLNFKLEILVNLNLLKAPFNVVYLKFKVTNNFTFTLYFKFELYLQHQIVGGIIFPQTPRYLE